MCADREVCTNFAPRAEGFPPQPRGADGQICCLREWEVPAIHARSREADTRVAAMQLDERGAPSGKHSWRRSQSAANGSRRANSE